MSDPATNLRRALLHGNKWLEEFLDAKVSDLLAAFTDDPNPEAAFSEPEELPITWCRNIAVHAAHRWEDDCAASWCDGVAMPITRRTVTADELVEDIVTRAARLLHLRQVARTIPGEVARHYSGHESDIDWAWQHLLDALDAWRALT